ncbi:MAG: hypothetical protein KAI47_03200 [Deltaproteobacteria bacterium]|nr:hypothetical protein [Deltaproteobacteria bacterium]
MLDPWIIEEIRRREEQERQAERPFLEVPLDPEDGEREQEVRDDDEKRGVVVIDYRL